MTDTILQADEQAVADAAAVILKQAGTILSGVAGNPVTEELEKIAPGLTGVVAKLAVAGSIASGLGAAIPVIEEVAALYEAGIIKGAEPDDPAFTRRDEDRPAGTDI